MVLRCRVSLCLPLSTCCAAALLHFSLFFPPILSHLDDSDHVTNLNIKRTETENTTLTFHLWRETLFKPSWRCVKFNSLPRYEKFYLWLTALSDPVSLTTAGLLPDGFYIFWEIHTFLQAVDKRAIGHMHITSLDMSKGSDGVHTEVMCLMQAHKNKPKHLHDVQNGTSWAETHCEGRGVSFYMHTHLKVIKTKIWYI